MAHAQDTVDWLLNQSHNYPLLTAQQEIEYSRQVKLWLELKDKPNPSKREQALIRRGKRAYDAFFLCNIRLVMTVASRYPKSISGNLGLDDLIQEGLLGLERAIVKFDPTRGYKFSTYAFNWIRQSINRGISLKARSIRLPYSGSATLKKARDFMSAYEREHGQLPPLALVAEHCNIKTVETLKAYLAHDHAPVSLDQQVKSGRGDSEGTYLDMIADLPAEPSLVEERGDLTHELHHRISMLPEAEQHILQRRYFDDPRDSHTFREIAGEIGLSRHTTQQKHAKALQLLRGQLAHHRALADTPALQSAA